jgi:hypothetical protein
MAVLELSVSEFRQIGKVGCPPNSAGARARRQGLLRARAVVYAVNRHRINRRECDPAHTSPEPGGNILAAPASGCGRGRRAMEGAMWRAKLRNKSVSRVELDQRAREARLRLEQVERLLSRAALKRSAVRRLLYLCSGGIFASASRESRTRGPLSNRRPSRMPTMHDVWVEECGSFCRASDLSLCHPSA